MGPETLRFSYAGSAGADVELPRWRFPEVAIAGRSNVGKSSLVNSLGGSPRLARVSRTPGRTQRLHFFLDEKAGLVLVDLPGWGFARASRERREEWGKAVEHYLATRENLRAILLLLDVRRNPAEDERLLEEFARRRALGLIRVATKVDKLVRSERERRLAALAAGGGAWIPFSAHTGEGRREIVEAIGRRFSGRSNRGVRLG